MTSGWYSNTLSAFPTTVNCVRMCHWHCQGSVHSNAWCPHDAMLHALNAGWLWLQFCAVDGWLGEENGFSGKTNVHPGMLIVWCHQNTGRRQNFDKFSGLFNFTTNCLNVDFVAEGWGVQTQTQTPWLSSNWRMNLVTHAQINSFHVWKSIR